MKAIRRICKGDSVPCLQITDDRIRRPPEEAKAEDKLWGEIMKHMGSNFEKLLNKLFTRDVKRLKQFIILVRFPSLQTSVCL